MRGTLEWSGTSPRTDIVLWRTFEMADLVAKAAAELRVSESADTYDRDRSVVVDHTVRLVESLRGKTVVPVSDANGNLEVLTFDGFNTMMGMVVFARVAKTSFPLVSVTKYASSKSVVVEARVVVV